MTSQLPATIRTEPNPYRPDIPEGIRDVSPELYSYLLELAETLREQHNKRQAGDSTFDWMILTEATDEQFYTVGSLGRFFHPTYGLILGRYVQFDSIDSSVWSGAPYGFVADRKEFGWRVTNVYEDSRRDLIVGVGASYTTPSDGQFGWVIVSGVNIQGLRVESTPAQWQRLAWGGSGTLTTNDLTMPIARIFGHEFEEVDDYWLVAAGAAYIDALSLQESSQIGFDSSAIEQQLIELEQGIAEVEVEFQNSLTSVTSVIDGRLEVVNRLTRALNTRITAVAGSVVSATNEVNDSLQVMLNFRNAADVAAANAVGAAGQVHTTLIATNQVLRLVTARADETGYYAESASVSRNEAIIANNESGVNAAASAVSASNAAVSETAAGASASAALTSETNAATSAGNASTSAGAAATSAGNASTSASQASTSASNAAGSASSASTSQTAAANSYLAARTGAAVVFPSTFEQQGRFFTQLTGDPATQHDLQTGDHGGVYNYTGDASGPFVRINGPSFSHLRTRQLIPNVAGTRWRVRVRWRFISDPPANNTTIGIGVYGLEDDFTTLHYEPDFGTTESHPTIADSVYTGKVSADGSGWFEFGLDIVPNGLSSIPWIAPGAYVVNSVPSSGLDSGSADIILVEVREVTDSYASELAADAAATSESNAATSATAAGTSATAASGSATTASTQAGNAATSAGAAATSAGNASTSASQASTSASNAAGSASSASTSQTAAANSSISAQSAATKLIPYRVSNRVDFTSAYNTTFLTPDTVNSPLSTGTDLTTPEGAGIQYTGGASQNGWIATRGWLPVISGHTYRATIRIRTVTASSTPTDDDVYCGFPVYTAAGVYLDLLGWTGNDLTGSFANYVRTISGAAILAAQSTARFVRAMGMAYVPSAADGVYQVVELRLEDITGETNAANSASAAATSESNAATSATNAGTSATSATNSANTATTQAGNASASASAASTSAATASTQAGNAASSAASASTSSTVSANASNAARRFAELTGPDTFEDGGTFFDSYGSNLLLTTPLTDVGALAGITFPVVSGIGKVLQYVHASTFYYIMNRRYFKLETGHTYRATTKTRITAGQSQNFYINIFGYDANGDFLVDASYGYLGLFGPADGWKTWDLTKTTAEFLAVNSGIVYVAANVLIGHPTGAANSTTQVAMLRFEDITLQAQVNTIATATSDLENRVATADFDVSTTAGGAVAALRLRSRAAGSGTYTSAALEAQEIQFYNEISGVRVLAGQIAGGRSLWTGDMDILGAMRVGSQRIPIALQSFTVLAGDGDTVDFGIPLGRNPICLPSPLGLASKTAAQEYDIRANSLDDEGFVCYAKILTPGSPSAVSSTSGSNVGGSPAWQMQKSDAADAYNGIYVFTATLNVVISGAWAGNPPYEPPEDGSGVGGFTCYIRPSGGSWTEVGAIVQGYTDSSNGTISVTLVCTVNFGDAVGQHGSDTEFGITADFGTITAFNSVAWTKQSSSGVSSATPSGQKVVWTIIPQNS